MKQLLKTTALAILCVGVLTANASAAVLLNPQTQGFTIIVEAPQTDDDLISATKIPVPTSNLQ